MKKIKNTIYVGDGKASRDVKNVLVPDLLVYYSDDDTLCLEYSGVRLEISSKSIIKNKDKVLNRIQSFDKGGFYMDDKKIEYSDIKKGKHPNMRLIYL